MSNATGASAWTAGPAICKVGGTGLILPLGGDSEHAWPGTLRAVIYGLGMTYTFLGVAIIADAFVAAIECITARKRQVKTKSGRIATEKVWNDTVATLSLMALGSSAPEIALSVVDLFKKQFHFTPLGAQTIAGSAAFNLLVIVAICIVAIPSTETRQIQELPAFYVTAAVSVFAYFWLGFILIILSPNVVEVWEAVTTFLFLPMLIYVSYKVDVGDATRFLARLTCKSGAEAEAESEAHAVLIGFDSEELVVEMGSEDPKIVDVPVKRPPNATGPLAVSFRTEALQAVPGVDYLDTEGRLEFHDEGGELEEAAEQLVSLEILPKKAGRVDRKFLVFMEGPEGHVGFDGTTDGGKDSSIMTVTIRSASREGSSLVRCIDGLVNIGGLSRAKEDWKEQVSSSIFVGGSLEEQQEASKFDWLSHILTLPWKLLFSLVPPTTLWGGWACFYVSLAMIAVLTIFISDLAELFGCVLDVRDDITAITFVALGTSMPDLFASLSAAREEPTADASIVNVTGSNSVNVFLGLGLPWAIGSIYWTLQGQTEDWKERYPHFAAERGRDGGGAFIVESRNLGFCVLVFSAACAMALLLLHLRRQCLGAELGGPFVPKVVTFVAFILYWLGFIGVASWRISRGAIAQWSETFIVIGGAGAFELGLTIVAVASICAHRRRPGPGQDGDARESGIFRQSQSGTSMGSASQASLKRSQSGLSITSNSSRSSKEKRGVFTKAMSSSSLSEGALGVTSRNVVGLRMLKPRFVNHVREQRI